MAPVEISGEFAEAIRHNDPSEDIRRDLSRKLIVPIIGPTAIGKSTLIDGVCEAEPIQFHRVQSFTTRPQRPGEPDDLYRWLPHTQATLDELYDKVMARSLVQITPHPTTGYLYGSEPQDYPSTYNLLDTLSGEVDNLRRLPFGYCVAIAVAVDPDHWCEWFMARYRKNPNIDDATKRLIEAEESLAWSLKDRDVMWVQNYPQHIDTGVGKIIAIAKGGATSERVAQVLGIRMRSTIPKLTKMIMEAAA